MPCHPARARQLIRKDRARPCHKGGVFHIHLKDRNRSNAKVQMVALNIDPGARTSGYAVTRESEDGTERSVIGAYQVRHRAHAVSAKLTKRAMHRRTRRSRLRHRPPRFDNRRKPQGRLAPSVRHLASEMTGWAKRIIALYPVCRIRIETAVFDTQAMQDPEIHSTEYQRRTLHGWQLRAYVLHCSGNRCVYCDSSDTRLEIEHIVPRSRGGTDRVDNLTASCAPCNRSKGNMPIERFLADDPRRLTRIMRDRRLTNLTGAAHLNIVMPTVLRELSSLGLPFEQTDAATTSWNRRKLDVPKSHVADAAVLGNCKSLTDLPKMATTITGRARNGRRFRAQVDAHGTVRGRAWREFARLKPYQQAGKSPPGHSSSQKRFGEQRIASGDLVRIRHSTAGQVTGQAVIANAGTRIRITGSKPSRSAALSRTILLRRDPGFTLTRESLMQDARRIS